MGEKLITMEKVEEFKTFLIAEEKAENTVGKYMRDVRAFAAWQGRQPVTKEKVVEYKAKLLDSGYAKGSVNSMLVSLNRFFCFLSWHELRVKTLKLQRQIYCPEEKDLSWQEFERLIQAARSGGDERLEMLLQTIVATGVRVSELRFITVEAAKSGAAAVSLKGKTRPVIIVKKLKKLLLSYARKRNIVSGPIFITRSGRPMSRTNVWREMKRLCEKAGVSPSKVFPHNLRHLFARIFYRAKQDIVKLADVLGHASIETTRLYVISTGAEHRKYLESLPLIM